MQAEKPLRRRTDLGPAVRLRQPVGGLATQPGSIRLPQRAGWLEDFIAELLAFPARHDDQVDALTQALAWSFLAGSFGGCTDGADRYCKRLIGSTRRECLDQIVVIGEVGFSVHGVGDAQRHEHRAVSH